MTPRPEPRPIPPPIVLTCTDHVLCPASPLSLAVLSAGGPSSQLASHISTTLAQSARPKGVIPPLLSTVCWRGEWASGSPWAAAGAAAAAAGAPREKETDETTTSRGIPRDMDEWERWRAEDEAGGGLEQSAQRSAEMEPPAAGDVRDVNRADSSVHAAEAPSLHLRLTQSGLANMLGASSTKPGLTGSDSAGKRKKAKLTDAPGNREDGYNVAPNAVSATPVGYQRVARPWVPPRPLLTLTDMRRILHRISTPRL